MELRDLRAFLVVAEERSISRAAVRIFLSQPGLSRLIQRLEAEVGAPLFDRGGAELRLTQAGVALFSHANDLVAALHQAAVDTRTAPSRAEQTLTVGVLFPAAAELTRPILETYRRSAPGVDVRLVDVSRLGGEHAVLTQEVSVAFVWTPVASPALRVVPLYSDSLTLLVGKRHPLASRPGVEVDEIADEPYTVTTTMTDAWRLASMLPPWRERPHRARAVHTVNEAMRAVADGAAMTIGPLSLSRYAPSDGIRHVPINYAPRPAAVLCAHAGDRRAHVTGFISVAELVAGRLRGLVPEARPV